ncbi:hypothetical protein [Deinococcus sp. UYEF24]
MNLLDLIRHPHAFYAALKRLPPVSWRYAWLPALAGLVGGISGALLSRRTLESQALSLGTPVAALFALTILSSVFVSMLVWLVLWGMGHLGAGKEGRSGEVYATSFLAPLLWSVVLAVLALILPPQVNVVAPKLMGLSGPELLTAVQRYSQEVAAQYSLSPVVRLSSVMNYAIYLVQFWLAYIGFRVMTGGPELGTSETAGTQTTGQAGRGRAWRGVLFPGVLFVLLGVVAFLITSALYVMGHMT